jgi:hypothetical protein
VVTPEAAERRIAIEMSDLGENFGVAETKTKIPENSD